MKHQTEKDRYCMVSLICRILKKTKTKNKKKPKIFKKHQIHRKEIVFVVIRSRELEQGKLEEGGQKVQISSYKLKY